MSRKLTFAAVVLGAFCAISPAIAADEFNVAPGLTYGGAPLGLHGADPVALLDHGQHVEGSASYAAAHEGVAFYFASEESLAAFKANPARYAPQHGGFCAFGVYVGKKLDGDVRYADIFDGKLYLFVNKAIFEKYLEDRENVISGAFAKWPDIMETPVGDL